MEPTICHSHHELTESSYPEHGTQVIIQPFKRKVYVVSRDISSKIVKDFEWIILNGTNGTWMSISQDPSFREADRTQADEPLEIPLINLSPIFRQNDLKSGGRGGSRYHYLSVVQGRCGWKAKLVVRYTFDELSQSIFYEALNGYSTVFVGAVTDTAHESASIFRNVSVEQISGFREIGSLSTGTLGIVC